MQQQDSHIQLKKTDMLFILGFILGIAILSFTFGVRVGKKTALHSLGKAQFEKLNEQKHQTEMDEVNQNIKISENKNQNKKEEIDEFQKETIVQKTKVEDEQLKQSSKPMIVMDKSVESVDGMGETIPYISSGDMQFKNKKTIVIGEFLDFDQAQLFAKAFEVRGYEVYIQQHEQAGINKLRVSLGKFDSANLAQDYMASKPKVFLKNKYQVKSFF